MSETTQQRIERIAEHYAFREGEKSRIIAALTAFAEEQEKDTEKDAERLNWLEEWAKKSPTGISVDRVKACEGDPAGFRFMRRFYIGLPYKSIRTAIDFEINYETPSTGEKPE